MINPFETLFKKLEAIDLKIEALRESQPVKSKAEDEEIDLLNVEQAAKFLSLEKQTIYQKVSKRQIPFMKRSKNLYFSKKALLKYLAEGAYKTTEEIQTGEHTYTSKRKLRK